MNKFLRRLIVFGVLNCIIVDHADAGFLERCRPYLMRRKPTQSVDQILRSGLFPAEGLIIEIGYSSYSFAKERPNFPNELGMWSTLAISYWAKVELHEGKGNVVGLTDPQISALGALPPDHLLLHFDTAEVSVRYVPFSGQRQIFDHQTIFLTSDLMQILGVTVGQTIRISNPHLVSRLISATPSDDWNSLRIQTARAFEMGWDLRLSVVKARVSYLAESTSLFGWDNRKFGAPHSQSNGRFVAAALSATDSN